MPKYFEAGTSCNVHQMFLSVPGGYKREVNIKEPNYCPYENSCTSYELIMNSSVNSLIYKKRNDNGNYLDVNGYVIVCLFKCISCHKFSALEYRSDFKNVPQFYPITYSISNVTFDSPFGDDTKLISDFDPLFMKIYEQANLTEQLGYDEAFPIAYRRAFESLVKQTLIKQFKCDKKSVIKAKLSTNYNDLMEKSEQLGKEALFTTWLGNDYAHFYKLDPELSTPDCKVLKNRISNFVKMISIMKTTNDDEEYITEANKKRGK